MSILNAKEVKSQGKSNYVEQDVLEAGSYPVRLVQIIDLGVQEQRPFQGQQKPPVQMLHITLEFTDEFMKDENGEEREDKPRWLSEEFPFYSLSADRAKSTQRYKAFDPNEEHEGSWPELLGLPANAMVTSYQLKNGPNAGKFRNKIDSLSAMRARDASKTPELVNEPKLFALEDPDLEVFLSLPEFLQDKIKGNLEYEGSKLQKLLEGGSKASKKEPTPTPKAEEEEVVEEPVEPSDDIDEDETPW